MTDTSNGYNNIAEEYIKTRGRAVNGVGSSLARTWAQNFTPGSTILDLGCGTGIPVTKILRDAGLNAYAIDASQKMVVEFQKNFPDTPVACEPVEQSSFFNRTFDGIISVGLMFLLSEQTQRILIPKMAAALNTGGRLLFTSPRQQIEWIDAMTGQLSRSLGAEEYKRLIESAGLVVGEAFEDEGGNYYYSGMSEVSGASLPRVSRG